MPSKVGMPEKKVIRLTMRWLTASGTVAVPTASDLDLPDFDCAGGFTVLLAATFGVFTLLLLGSNGNFSVGFSEVDAVGLFSVGEGWDIASAGKSTNGAVNK